MKTSLLVSVAAVFTSWLPGVLSGAVVDRSRVKVTRAQEAVNYNAVASHVVPMRHVVAKPGEKGGFPNTLHSVYSNPADGSTPPPLPGASLRNMKDIYYIIDIQVGKQIVPVHVDTGSSDTWLIGEKFQCVNYNYLTVPMEKCGFGKGFVGNFSQGTIPDQDFVRLYGDSTFVIGSYGFEDVTIGGLTAKHQELALVNHTYWYSDGSAAGLLGLAYPFMTDTENSTRQYDPVFTSMWKQNLTRPMFTMALSRDVTTVGKGETAKESYLAFGGVPPNVDYDDSSWARTPIRPLKQLGNWWWVDPKQEGLYVIAPEAFVYDKHGLAEPFTNTTEIPMLIDAGSTLTYLPAELAQDIYNQFDPPAEWHGSGGAWYAPCNATVPKVGIQIGAELYQISPADLLRQTSRDVETGTLCRIGIMDANVPPYILGLTFLTNVVAVFDVGNNEMRFAKRNKY